MMRMTRSFLVLLALAWLGACDAADSTGSDGAGTGTGAGGSGSGTGTGGGGTELPSGKFPGTYEVPVPAELAAAAIFDVPKIDWRVHEGRVELDYDLPLGLVGKPLRVSFEGPLDEAADTLTLTGDAGTATCTIAGGTIDCNETMHGLLPIEVDYDVVEERARAEYDGPVEDRLDVARRFSGDPIGIAHIDATAPLDGGS